MSYYLSVVKEDVLQAIEWEYSEEVQRVKNGDMDRDDLQETLNDVFGLMILLQAMVQGVILSIVLKLKRL